MNSLLEGYFGRLIYLLQTMNCWTFFSFNCFVQATMSCFWDRKKWPQASSAQSAPTTHLIVNVCKLKADIRNTSIVKQQTSYIKKKFYFHFKLLDVSKFSCNCFENVQNHNFLATYCSCGFQNETKFFKIKNRSQFMMKN